MTQFASPPTNALPDPDYDHLMYRDVATKRLFAWVIDVVLISILVAVLALFTAFLAVLILPMFYAVISFVYRTLSLAAVSATPGMMVMAITIRNNAGERLSSGQAFLHTLGYFVSFAVFPLQCISVAMMFLSERNQGLSDALLGTTALNRSVT